MAQQLPATKRGGALARARRDAAPSTPDQRPQAQPENVAQVVHGGMTWVNIQKPTLAEMEYLRSVYGFHTLALDDCLSRVQIPKVDDFDTYLFVVLHFPLFNHAQRITLPSQISAFIGSNFVVTISAGELRPLAKFFQDCLDSEAVRAESMSSGSGYLFYRILDGLVDYCFPILNKIALQVDNLEEHVFDSNDRWLIRELSVVRRDIISYRRLIRLQVPVLEALEAREYAYMQLESKLYFGDLADHIRRLWMELENLREVMEALYDTHRSLVNHRATEVTRILTIAATVVLPYLIIASLYGMNVGLPFEDSPFAFAMVMLGSTAISVAMLLYLRVRRWL